MGKFHMSLYDELKIIDNIDASTEFQLFHVTANVLLVQEI